MAGHRLAHVHREGIVVEVAEAPMPAGTQLLREHPVHVRGGHWWRLGLQPAQRGVVGLGDLGRELVRSLDGAQPTSGLTVGPDNNLYGVTPVGGVQNFPGNGTVYKVAISK